MPVRLGLFPARVDTGTHLYDMVRVYATDDVTEIWAYPGQPTIVATGPGLVKQARGMDQFMSDGTRAKWTLRLADDTVWLVTPTGGCGCGHPLRRFDPSKADRSVAT